MKNHKFLQDLLSKFSILYVFICMFIKKIKGFLWKLCLLKTWRMWEFTPKSTNGGRDILSVEWVHFSLGSVSLFCTKQPCVRNLPVGLYLTRPIVGLEGIIWPICPLTVLSVVLNPCCDEFTWWRHRMETFSALLAPCERNSPVTGKFPSQKSVTRSFAVFVDLRLHKRVSKPARPS